MPSLHTTPHPDGGWQVKKGGASRASYRTDTQAEADFRARNQAKREGLEYCLHNKQGQIRQKDSYGNDPFPPRDKKN